MRESAGSASPRCRYSQCAAQCGVSLGGEEPDLCLGRGCGGEGRATLRVIFGKKQGILERVSEMEGSRFGKGQLCPCGSVMVIFYLILALGRNLGFCLTRPYPLAKLHFLKLTVRVLLILVFC